ncbi:MAG TPA: type II toxin-antitoxin system prevent-host-death family antitoxin [bacterium]|nr:type II toxin-antitoxin system prevent-host-death family antitoxin [bacterium]HPN44753.1 type II toxin-antitoxin system prevent-host-death family antitoxin [bacterium]
MKFINIKELSKSPSKYIKSANEEGDIIITRNGQPYALLSKIDGDELEDYILARHYDLEKQFDNAQQEYESGATIPAKELLEKLSRKSVNDI